MDSKSKVAVIVGRDSKIIERLVEKFLQNEYRVVANCKPILLSSNINFFSVGSENSAPASAEALISAAVVQYGRVDTLVNCISAAFERVFEEYTAPELVQQFGSQVERFLHGSKLAASKMLACQSGHIVHLTGGIFEVPNVGTSNMLDMMAEGAILVGTRCLAIKYAETGIRINAVSRSFQSRLGPVESSESELGLEQPPGEFDEMDAAVKAVLYLDSMKYITGEVHYVDGHANTIWPR